MPSARKPRLRALASRAVLWTGLVLISVLAIPAGMLFGMIILIWEALDRVLKKIETI